MEEFVLLWVVECFFLKKKLKYIFINQDGPRNDDNGNQDNDSENNEEQKDEENQEGYNDNEVGIEDYAFL